MDLLTTWWLWALASVALFVLEVMAPGFIFLGFGIGAAVVALMMGFGFVSFSVPTLLLVFAVISAAAWFAMRQIFGVRKGQVKKWDIDINDDV